MVIASMMALAACTSTTEEPAAPSSPEETDQWAGDSESWEDDVVGCLQEKGWDASVAPEGGFEAAFPTDQEEQYRADVEACHDELGDAMDPPPMSSEEVERAYDMLLDVATCVRGLGFEVPEAPSKQAYVEHLVNNGIGPWHPYDGITEPGDPDSQWREAKEECPVESP